MNNLRRSTACAGLIGLSFSLFMKVQAQDWTVYDMANSPLPSTTVNALAEDPAGGVWIGTDWGLCHFNGGDDWQIYQVGTSGIPSNDIRALAVDGEGRLWIGTLSDGLCVWDGATWITYNTVNSPLPVIGIRDLYVDHRDWVWITTSGGLACFTGSEWRIYDDSEQSYGGLVMNTGNTRCVAVRQDGLVCLGTFNGGLHFLTETDVSYLTTVNDGFFDNTATDILFDPVSGDRWVATPAAGLLRQQGPAVGGSWNQWNSSIGFPSNAVNSIAMDGTGQVWAGSQFFGLIRVDVDDSFTSFTEANSDLPDDEIPSVLAASDGAIWLGTVYGGLVRFQPTAGMRESGQVSAIRVFPNPASDWCTVTTPEVTGPWQWDLYDALGRPVVRGLAAGSSIRIPLSGLDAGGYHLFLLNGELRYIAPLVVK